MDKLLELVNSLPKEQGDIFYKFMGAVAACEKDIDEKLFFAKEKNIVISSSNSLIKFFSEDIESIKEKYKKYEEAGLADAIKNYPELIRYDSDTVLERVGICQKVGKPFMVNNKYADFLFNDSLWKAVEKSININDDYDIIDDKTNETKDLSEWAIPELDEVVSKALNISEPLDLDEDDYDRYMEVSSIIKGVKEALGVSSQSETKDSISLPITSDELISRLIKVSPSLSNEELAKYCLKYCDGLDAGVDEIIEAISSSMSEEKRGL